MAKELLNLGALARRYRRSERTITRWKNDGRLPKPDVLLPGDKPGWFESTIERHEQRGFASSNLTEATV
jgi:hypothetical protein